MYSEFLCQGNISKRSLSTYINIIIYNHINEHAYVIIKAQKVLYFKIQSY